ncbi:MAG TPA: DUF3566 domain-containing protein [Terriglobales bacterium]|nr:DUF3566 domain-containing protein [Terriglobales bacterium]
MTKIRSIRVLSAAKVNAVLYGILGLLFAPIVLFGPGLATLGGQRRGFGGAVIVAAILPFFYACIGFVAGTLIAFIYNAISQAIGGIEVELELPPPIFNMPLAAAAPPAPSPLPPPAPPPNRVID